VRSPLFTSLQPARMAARDDTNSGPRPCSRFRSARRRRACRRRRKSNTKLTTVMQSGAGSNGSPWGPVRACGSGLSPASDVFGLGVTLGGSLTGVLPYGLEGRWRRGVASRCGGEP
jgi:hypothetical protein